MEGLHEAEWCRMLFHSPDRSEFSEQYGDSGQNEVR
jgi:hypothetical protein